MKKIIAIAVLLCGLFVISPIANAQDTPKKEKKEKKADKKDDAAKATKDAEKEAKKKAKAELPNMPQATFNKAWQDLRNDGKLKDAA